MKDKEELFTNDDFERWFLHGANRSDRITELDREQLLENCNYICQAEVLSPSQSTAELRAAIDRWADDWNESRD